MKLLISGGHLTPALAFIEYIQKEHPSDEIIFIGRLYSKKNKQQISQEKTEIEKLGVRFIPFTSVKLTQNTLLAKIISIPSLLLKAVKTTTLIAKEKPDIFVSFGGYLAIPVAIACWIMRVPVVTHEQTRTAGIANTIISKFANKIAISYKESETYFPKSRTVLTGNLIRQAVLQTSKVLPEWMQKKPTKPLLYITGGSQGSEIINRTVSQILKPLLKNWVVIHQCGKPSGTTSYLKELTAAKNQLSQANQENYYIREWITKDELAWIYSNAEGVISRSGANTTEEIALNKIPAVLIPLPFSHNDEQLKNAQALSNNKQAILLEQKNLTPEVLLEATDLIQKYHRKFSRNLQLFSKIKHSEKKLYELAESLIQEK
ncbi:MAG: UDP-N-acetylglucosamine--N-acetylmuramyl-(pentapeptide) pyrophosphoryl-undecaprenol N-acetylglucosamine transferase [Patescibacteria group bacterium]|nr:MAG: UDP-N-acetylglucosamine--N-acetylmuramyl-(pentapeptide) pyrophosphoryl-undecaprenol N-acetylglucosamine transferase [Patescibacteria group bacterium]